MTLVVARIEKGQIAIASDTMLTEPGKLLPHQSGAIKTCMLPGRACVSFSNSSESAVLAISEFWRSYPRGTSDSAILDYFENSSRKTNNDYIIAFVGPPRLVKIADGRRVSTSSPTLWIGDKDAYEKFREQEAKVRKGYEHGRALSMVLFADEAEGSPASDLYSVMRHLVAEPAASGVGGFVCTVGGRLDGFRYSVYSDALANWPEGKGSEFELRLPDKIHLGASGENSDYAVCQISSAYVGLNSVAFYLLKAKKVFLYYTNGAKPPTTCHVLSDVEPADIESKLREVTQIPRWFVMVTSIWSGDQRTVPRAQSNERPTDGVSMRLYWHANTMPTPGDATEPFFRKFRREDFC